MPSSGTHLRYLPRSRIEFLHGRGESRAAGPAGRSHGRATSRAQRLQLCATPRPTGTAPSCPRGTCRIRAIKPAMSAIRLRRPTMHTLAANSVLHTGISSGCAQCHGGTTQLTFYNNTTTQGSAVLTPPHIPYLSGTDCGSCHASTTYAVGGFGPMNMTQATHAFVGTTCDTCHEAGLSFYMGAASPALQGRPADHTRARWSRRTTAASATPRPTGTPPPCPRATCRIPATRPARVCHTAAPANYDHARGQRRAAHRHHQRLHQLPWRTECGAAGVLFELHAQGCGALAGAHPDQHHALRELPRGELHRVQRHHDELRPSTPRCSR